MRSKCSFALRQRRWLCIRERRPFIAASAVVKGRGWRHGLVIEGRSSVLSLTQDTPS